MHAVALHTVVHGYSSHVEYCLQAHQVRLYELQQNKVLLKKILRAITLLYLPFAADSCPCFWLFSLPLLVLLLSLTFHRFPEVPSARQHQKRLRDCHSSIEIGKTVKAVEVAAVWLASAYQQSVDINAACLYRCTNDVLYQLL
jgi:hypothetical protein